MYFLKFREFIDKHVELPEYHAANSGITLCRHDYSTTASDVPIFSKRINSKNVTGLNHDIAV